MHGLGDYHASWVKLKRDSCAPQRLPSSSKPEGGSGRGAFDFDARDIGVIATMHLPHARAPAARMGIVATDVTREESCCARTFAVRRPEYSA